MSINFWAYLIISISCAFYCGTVAKSKGHEYTPWFFGGFFFSLFALISAAGLPDLKLRISLGQIPNQEGNLSTEEAVKDYWKNR